VKITRSALEAIKAHGIDGFPYEICGLLIGRDRGLITEVRRLTNVEKNEPKVKYSVDSAEDMRVRKELRGTDLDVFGYYHSHPNHPAYASETDALRSWETYVYIIVSVHDREPGEAKAFVAEKDHGPLNQVDLEVV
jgi:proteasome lid subunit RPN8/RPN11